MVQISVSNKTISFSSWSNYASGNTNSADVSAKGIKAENEIYIKKGTIDIKAYDDAIHANNDGIIENGSSPLGNIIISGGSTTVEASDDAIHADGSLTISDGEINVKSAYEGLEANVINISGGSEKTPTTNSKITKTLCSSSSVSTGSHTVSFSNNTSYQTTLKNSSRGCVVYSALGTATLK